jgi:hypothetical protein
VDKVQAAGIKVVILTATMIYEDPNNTFNQKLAAYNDFLRSLAKQKNCLLADLNAEMQAAVAAGKSTQPKGNILTVDGVHMNPIGNQMMASGILKTFGLTDSQLQKAQAFWQDIPAAVEVNCKAAMSLRQYQQLSQLAAQQKTSVDALLNKQATDSVQTLLGTAPAK